MNVSDFTISIIIPVYNGALLIERCLKSVSEQEGDFKTEIILVDDGSTDDSIAIAQAHFPDILVLEQKNQGPAAARNNGVRAASGKYLAFLDADDYWYPSFLKETILFLESHDVVAVNVGQVHKIIGKADKVMPQFIENYPLSSTHGEVLDDFYAFWSKHNHVCTGSVVMPTEIVKQTGGQRTDLRITEDLEFWAYLATFGKWGFIPKVLFVSDGGEVTKAQGWIEKNKKRWASAPTIENWEKRIIKKIPEEYHKSFNNVKAPILKNLTLSMILSGRKKEARQMIKRNRATLKNERVSLVLKLSSYTALGWYLFSKLLIKREYNRKL